MGATCVVLAEQSTLSPVGYNNVACASPPTLLMEDVIADQWKHGMCECHRQAHCWPICYVTCFVPWVTIAQIQVRIGHAKSYPTALLSQLAVDLVALALMYVISSHTKGKYSFGSDEEDVVRQESPTSAGFWLAMAILVLQVIDRIEVGTLRTTVRRLLGIPGTRARDFMVVCCFLPCAKMQLVAQVNASQRRKCCFFGAPDVLPGYRC